ncbi:hypothetical protein K1719_023437 [Acacia pycnantha]|nr:hypothetical protein K1719_023437 [Acacia pycnantha]
MSLTNSCNVSATTFIVKDNKLVKKCEEGSDGNVDAVLFKDTAAGEDDINCKDSSCAKGTGNEDNQVVSGKTLLRSHKVEHDLCCENLQKEQRAAKRIHIPKRFVKGAKISNVSFANLCCLANGSASSVITICNRSANLIRTALASAMARTTVCSRSASADLLAVSLSRQSWLKWLNFET